jgi:hypothetical protein
MEGRLDALVTERSQHAEQQDVEQQHLSCSGE